MKLAKIVLTATMLSIVTTPVLAGPAHDPRNPEDVQASQAQRGETKAPRRSTGRNGLSQNGTTVPTADTVQAPKSEESALMLPAVQQARETAPRRERKMSQNGTRVPTASELNAPNREPSQRGEMEQNGTTVSTASEVQATEAQRGRDPR